MKLPSFLSIANLGNAFLCAAAFYFVAIGLVGAKPPSDIYQGDPSWADEFSGDSLDLSKWSYRDLGSGNADAKRRDAMNTTKAVVQKDGLLKIYNYTEDGIHYSGMISTADQFEPLFGYIEARISFVDLPGTWSAFWYQSHDIGYDEGFIGRPKNGGTEMDIMEHIPTGLDQVYATIHWNYNAVRSADNKATTGLIGEGLDEGYHVYGWEWTPDYCRLYIDGQPVRTFRKNPKPGELEAEISWRAEYIILSKEIQNNGWGGAIGEIPSEGYGPLGDARNSVMTVDWVKYYPLKAAVDLNYPDGAAAEDLISDGWSGTNTMVADGEETQSRMKFNKSIFHKGDCAVVELEILQFDKNNRHGAPFNFSIRNGSKDLVNLEVGTDALLYRHKLSMDMTPIGNLEIKNGDRVVLVLDLLSRTYDIYVNTKRVREYLPFLNKVNYMDSATVEFPVGADRLPVGLFRIR